MAQAKDMKRNETVNVIKQTDKNGKEILHIDKNTQEILQTEKNGKERSCFQCGYKCTHIRPCLAFGKQCNACETKIIISHFAILTQQSFLCWSKSHCRITNEIKAELDELEFYCFDSRKQRKS